MADIAKVKRNIQKMIDQGAPDSDIDAYLGDEGVTIDQLKFPSLTEDQPTSDMGRRFQTVDDSMRIAADSMTMGLFDKALGEEDQAKTRASRERAGWGGTAVDIGAGMVNPIRVGGKIGGAVLGGGQGALDAYGHQDAWIPDTAGEWGDIGKGAVIGSGLGAAGAKLGEWGGGLLDKFGYKSAKANEPFKSSGDLDVEAARREKLGYPAFAEDYKARSARVKEAEALQGKGRGEFDKVLKGMDLSPAERAAGEAVTKAPGVFKRGVSAAGRVASKIPDIGGTAALGLDILGLGGAATTARGVVKGADALGKSNWANRPSQQAVDELLSVMRDPNGKGYRLDDVGRNAARDLVSKFLASSGRNALR